MLRPAQTDRQIKKGRQSHREKTAIWLPQTGTLKGWRLHEERWERKRIHKRIMPLITLSMFT